MKKSVGRRLIQGAGINLSLALATVGVVALRHALETPRPLKSSLPGQALLYVWQRRSIFYKVLGEADAPPLVLLHRPALGASASEMQALMEPLARHYRVYAPDLLGFGLSDRPNIAYSAQLYTQLCEDFVREVVQQPAILVASHTSCNYAVALAARSPERCTALVLISPLEIHQRPPGCWQSWLASVQLPLLKMLLYPLLCTRLAFLLMHGRDEQFAQFSATTHQLGAEHAPLALLAGKLSSDVTRQFERLTQPILIIWGTQALEKKELLANLRDIPAQRQLRTVELIQGSGLLVHQEQPGKVLDAIERWSAAHAHALPTHEAAPEPVLTMSHTPAEAVPVTRSAPETFEQTQLASSTQTDTSSATFHNGQPASSTQTRASVDQPENPENPENPETHEGEEVMTDPGGVILTYCMRCKQKTAMQHPSAFTMKNGRQAVQGTCAICGTRTIRIGGFN